MDILASVRSADVVRAAVAITGGTAVLCYVLAVSNGHVPAWLPMISDCAVYPPEKYPFRLGIVLGASLLALHVVTTYYGDRAYSKSRLCLALGVVASACFAVVGVVNEKEDHPVHDTLAIISFTCYDIYAVLMIYHSWKEPRVPPLSYIVKVCSSMIAILSLIGRYILHILNMRNVKLCAHDLSDHLSLLEWTNFFALLIFFWSHSLDKPDELWLQEVKRDIGSASKRQKFK